MKYGHTRDEDGREDLGLNLTGSPKTECEVWSYRRDEDGREDLGLNLTGSPKTECEV